MDEVVIVDSGGANLASLEFALERLGVGTRITRAMPRKSPPHPGVILPGVGSAVHAMRRLRAGGLISVLTDLSCPVLGICLGCIFSSRVRMKVPLNA